MSGQKFVLKWEARFNEAEGGRVNLAELCRPFGISRQTGYEWVGRYRETGSIDSLVDRSRRPPSSPNKVSAVIEASVVAARKERPTWGAVPDGARKFVDFMAPRILASARCSAR
jgi:hypothetical protein